MFLPLVITIIIAGVLIKIVAFFPCEQDHNLFSCVEKCMANNCMKTQSY